MTVDLPVFASIGWCPEPEVRTIMPRVRLRTSGSKGALESKSASVPMISKFAQERAARYGELRNRDTSDTAHRLWHRCRNLHQSRPPRQRGERHGRRFEISADPPSRHRTRPE